MSEYQYYEFTAVDKPLNENDMQTLRDLSTRARITPTSFEYDLRKQPPKSEFPESAAEGWSEWLIFERLGKYD